jgi:hypothetical protein
MRCRAGGRHQDYDAGGLRGGCRIPGRSPYQIDLESQLEAAQYDDHSTNAAGERDFMIETPRSIPGVAACYSRFGRGRGNGTAPRSIAVLCIGRGAG